MLRAVELTQRYRLRGYDAVQLAAALVLNEHYIIAGFSRFTIVSSDNEINVAAQVEGLITENPNTHL